MDIFMALLFILLSASCIWHLLTRSRECKMLKNVPGQFVVPFVGSAILLSAPNGKNIINKIDCLSRTYGPNLKLFVGTKPLLVISDPDDTKTYLSHKGSVEKPYLMYGDLKNIIGKGFIVANLDMWRAHRKLLSKLFAPSRLHRHINNFQKAADELVLKLRNNNFLDSDLGPLVCNTVKLASHEYILGNGARSEEWAKLFSNVIRIEEIIGQKATNPLLWIGFIFYNFIPTGKELKLTLKETYYIIDQICERVRPRLKKNSAESYGALDILLESEFSQQEVWDELITLAMGATDSIAETVSLAFILLGLHPKEQENLYDEIINVLGPTDPVDSENIKKLQYTEMVVLETLRIFPIGPFYGRQNSSDVKLSSYTVPANTTVLFNVFTMHRNSEYWPDPLSFKPERFSPENAVNGRNMNAYTPFAGGQRMCPGSRFAILQAVVVLANVVRNYKISTGYKSVQDVPLEVGIFIRLPRGTKTTLQRRIYRN